jgi:glucosamine-phosphate N-acetyltransferase
MELFKDINLMNIFIKHKNDSYNKSFTIRPVNENDKIVELLSELTNGANSVYSVNPEEYALFIKSLNERHMVFVVELSMKGNEKDIAGVGSVFIEQKIIHSMGKVGHIEDIVISKKYRNHGIGKILINYLSEYCKEKGCYKVILNCSDENVLFYEKCGMKKKANQMALYFE